ncbi:MAG: hypothetical protein Q9225_006190 [Loekoesia sp. 1 TL-2023]
MDPVNFAASIGTLIGATAKAVKYLNCVRNASNERKTLSREATDLLPVLVRLKNQVDEPKQSEPWFESLNLLATEEGAFDQLQEALEKLTEKLKPEKGIKNIARNFIWTLDKDECDETLRKIERVKSRINLALQGDIHKLTQAIKADTAGIDTIKERVSELHISEDAKRRQEILRWFSPLNFFKTQQDIFRRREEGTGKWLIDSPDFQDWVGGSQHTLCCSGIPGAGKSVLASIVVDYLRSHSAPGVSFGVAAAYCNFKEQDTQSPENLLAGLCEQLMDDSEVLPDTLVKLYETHKGKQTRPTLKDVLSVFEELAKRFSTTYLIVDALDECLPDVRHVFVRELKSLQPMTRLLATTRPIDSIISQFDEDTTIEVRASYGDLEKYIKSRLESRRLSTLHKGQTKLLEDICNNVIDKANGM